MAKKAAQVHAQKSGVAFLPIVNKVIRLTGHSLAIGILIKFIERGFHVQEGISISLEVLGM